MNPDPVWSRFSMDDFRRMLEQVRDDGAMRDRLAQHPMLKRFIAPSHKAHLNDGLARSLRIIDELTLEERREPSHIDNDRRNQIARRARVKPLDVFELTHRFGYLAARIWMLTSKEFLEEVCPSLANPSDQRRRHRASTGVPRPRSSHATEPVNLAGLSLYCRMPPAERDAFRRHWNRLARSGLIPEADVALFSLWNRDLLLWDCTEDD